jgi:hypothetical protein
MHYTNDEQDRALRRRNFLLTVYVLPVIIALLIFGIIFFIAEKKWGKDWEIFYCYVISSFVGFYFYEKNKRKWMRMPDGTFHHVDGITVVHHPNPDEPASYEEEYFLARKTNVTSIILGLIVIGMGVYNKWNEEKSLFIPLITIAAGISFIYSGVRGRQDGSPQLKFAKEGLWTKKLGFVKWNDVAKAQVIEEGNGKNTQVYLDIYLRGDQSSESQLPVERLVLTNVEENQFVEMVLHAYLGKRNTMNS